MSDALLKAIKTRGSRRKLAKAIGTSPDNINAWLNRGVAVPLEYAFEIERVTQGEITWQEVAPHLAHYALRWTGHLFINNHFHIQNIHVAISRISHDCHIQSCDQSIHALADDIKQNGLQRPICINTDNFLIFSEKRLHAYEILGKKTIPAWKLSISDLINGQYAKEELRHTFVFSERVAISLAVEKFLGNRQGQRTDRILRQNFAEVKGRTDEFIATLLSFGNRQTYQQSKKIFRNAYPGLIKAIDQGRFNISTVATLMQFPIAHQKQIFNWEDKKISELVSQLRYKKQYNLSKNFLLADSVS